MVACYTPVKSLISRYHECTTGDGVLAKGKNRLEKKIERYKQLVLIELELLPGTLVLPEPEA